MVAVNLEAIQWKERKWRWRFFVFCGWWFSKQFDIVSEAHFSCDTVGSELWSAILSSLLCPETDRNTRIGKQGYVFILSDFMKWCFDVSFLTSISVTTVILTLGKVELFKQINLRNILFIGFVKFEINQWSSSSSQDQISVCFSLAWLPTETAREFFLDPILRKSALSFLFWLLEPVQCSARLFCTLSFAQSRKILSNSQNFPPF